jgi:hypothetical protein
MAFKLGIGLSGLFEKIDPVNVGQHDIQKGQIWAVLADKIRGFGRLLRQIDRVAFEITEKIVDQLTGALVVINNKQFGHILTSVSWDL